MNAFIVDAVRTPRGAGNEKGSLRTTRPDALVAALIRELGARGIPFAAVEDLILGCVTQTGDQGGNVAKTAAMTADLPSTVSAATVNRYCASSLDAIGIAAMRIASGGAELVLAGGVESMSRVPMLSDHASHYADPEVLKKTKFVHMGVLADALATLRGFSREDLDEVARMSHERAVLATTEGRFAKSLVPVPGASGEPLTRDELARPGITLEKLARFPAAFTAFGEAGGDDLVRQELPAVERIDHRHSVVTSPGMADGASLLALASEAALKTHGLRARGRIRSVGYAAAPPMLLLTGAVIAAERALALAGLSAKDIDLFECNESFSATVLEFRRAFALTSENVNVNGGAIAMGHPLGASGGILVATLLDELERTGKKLGLASIPGGAGVSVSVIVERI